MTPYTLIRSRRKTAALYVKDGCLEVRAPLRMPKKEIDRFVLSKEQWITDRLARSREQKARREAFALYYGDYVTYRGGQYQITAKPGENVGFDGEAFFMPPGLPEDGVKAACIQIYRLLARRHLTARVKVYAKIMDIPAPRIKINGAKTRWGSCSKRGGLNFSWRVIMAADTAIDYVVVHELAHIIEMNHSARFWAVVSRILPDYKKEKQTLKTLQRRLSGEDWSQ